MACSLIALGSTGPPLGCAATPEHTRRRHELTNCAVSTARLSGPR
jgi:hypothetical protein